MLFFSTLFYPNPSSSSGLSDRPCGEDAKSEYVLKCLNETSNAAQNANLKKYKNKRLEYKPMAKSTTTNWMWWRTFEQKHRATEAQRTVMTSSFKSITETGGPRTAAISINNTFIEGNLSKLQRVKAVKGGEVWVLYCSYTFHAPAKLNQHE